MQNYKILITSLCAFFFISWCVTANAQRSISLGSLFGPKRVKAEVLCEKIKKNEVLRRYLRVTKEIDASLPSESDSFYSIHWNYYNGYSERKYTYRNLRFETSSIREWKVNDDAPDNREREYPGDFFNEGKTVEKWFREFLNRNKNGVWDPLISEKQINEVVDCVYTTLGTDYFRLFTESGSDYALLIQDQLSGVANKQVKSDNAEIELDNQGNVIKEKQLDAADIKKSLANTLYVALEGGNNERSTLHNRGLLFFLMLYSEGENVINNVGPEILDKWERMLGVMVAENKILRARQEEEEDERKRRELAAKEARQNVDPNQEKYAGLYLAYSLVENCYQARKGYLAVYISDPQYQQAKSSFSKHRKNSQLTESNMKDIEEKLGDVVDLHKLLLMEGYSASEEQKCKEFLMGITFYQ